MNKFAIINDVHFGARNAHPIFEVELQLFFDNVLFPTIEEQNIKHLVIPGDLFNDRKAIQTKTVYHAKQLFDRLEAAGMRVDITPGNHDIYYRNSITPNSIEPLVDKYENIHYHSEPFEFTCGKTKCAMIPWICNENREELEEYIALTRAEVLLTHTDFKGSLIATNVHLPDGYEQSKFTRFKYILNGHIHMRSQIKNVHNLGIQYQLTWSDANQNKGFHIFDGDAQTLEFIENPSVLFRGISYSDDKVGLLDSEEWLKLNPHKIHKKFVKIFVVGNNDSKKLDRFIDKVIRAKPFDLKVIDNNIFTVDSVAVEDALEGNSLEHIISVIDEQAKEKNLNPDIMKKMMTTFYNECLTLE